MDEKRTALQQQIARSKVKIILASIAEAIILVLELYIMINYKSNFIAMGLCVLFMVVGLFFLISGILDINIHNKEIEVQKYDDIYNAQKASYLVIRKSFDEMDERLRVIEQNSQLPAEEIISAQKAVAKVTISRSKENTDALMNSNDELINHLYSIQEKLDGNNSEIIEKQQQMLNATKNELQTRILELTNQIANIEGRMAGGVPVAMVQAPVMSQPNIQETVVTENVSIDEPMMEPVDEVEDIGFDLDMDSSVEETTEEIGEEIGLDLDMDITMESPEIELENEAEEILEDSSEELDIDLDIDLQVDESSNEEELGLDINLEAPVEELPSIEENIEENVEENIEENIEEVTEEPVEEIPEEVPEEPEETVEAVAEAEEPEEVAATAQEPVKIPDDIGIDLSDPNRVMSPEEIEKLFASI